MAWVDFHHPDLCLPVIRRRATEEVLDLLLGLGEVVMTRGWSTMLRGTFPSDGAYRSAMYRLRKQGLIAYRRQGGRDPVLRLTAAGEVTRPAAFHPHRFWDRKWNRIWYVLMFDVPETERSYRTALRGFLQRLRMGGLQKSVYVTPHDIRPEYADLAEAGGVGSYAVLMEARTVLGQTSAEIVRAAWDVDRLEAVQAAFCRTCEGNLEKLRERDGTRESVLALARQEIAAYLQVMSKDPLLPHALWPAGYLGAEVFRLHGELGKEIGRRLRA